MNTTVRQKEWGVRHPDGKVETIDEASANEGYMAAHEYALRRAKAVGGQVVNRTRTVSVSKWTDHTPGGEQ